jgi:alginate O-acetyltransferase complex protein AlgJ
LKSFRIKSILIGLLCLGLLAVLPVLNWVLSPVAISITDSQRLFSTELLHGYFNRFLYHQGISADSQRVLVGRQGWLFDANEGHQLRDPSNVDVKGYHSPLQIKKSIRELKQRQQWMTDRGIMTLFVIVPDKQSIYSEFAPEQDRLSKQNLTDSFMASARSASLNVLDLRGQLLPKKSDSEPLYFRTDSHWNHYGAYLGYRDSIAAINEVYGAQIKKINPVKRQWVRRAAGNLAQQLMFDTLLDIDVDRDVELSFAGSEATLCIQVLAVNNLAPRGKCEDTRNSSITVDRHPHASLNQNALNRMNVVWVRDSFGNFNSTLYQQTFSRLWEIHHQQFSKMDWQVIVERLNADLVIYQVAEGAIDNMVADGSN